MKTMLTFFFCLLLFSCTNTENKKAAASITKDTPTASSSKTEIASKSDILKQQGDYSTLFNRERGDCNFITEEEIAKALDVSSDKILKEANSCRFNFSEANGATIRFNFMVEAWKNKTVLKEIKTAKENAEAFGKNSKLSQYRISETGDTYLSMHQNRMIRILNEVNENAIIIFYSVNNVSTENGAAGASSLKDKAREQSYAIANYLVNTHKQ